jgi:hypothetical protein
MYKRNKNRRSQNGGLLISAFLVSMALAVAMVGLITMARGEISRSESLLTRDLLRRMAQEKFTQDMIVIKGNRALTGFTASSTTFSDGAAESFLQPVNAGVTPYGQVLYMIVTATVTKESRVEPRHMRLETILEWSGSSAASSNTPLATATSARPVSSIVEDQMRGLFPDADQNQIDDQVRQVISQLETMLGKKLTSLSGVETAQYREVAPPAAPSKTAPEEFQLNPISIHMDKVAPRVRVWRETYY